MVQRSPLAIALAVAIVAFHALTNLQVRNLRLTDISDGRMTEITGGDLVEGVAVITDQRAGAARKP